MVKNAQSDISKVHYRPPSAHIGGIEVLSLAELGRRLATRTGPDSPQRTDFHQLLAVQDGTLRHMVDFAEHSAGPGEWLWVRPGQVQLFRDLTSASGHLVLFQSSAVDPDTATQTRLDDPFGLTRWNLSPDDADAAREALTHLAHAFDPARTTPSPARSRILSHLLAALLLQLTHPATPLGSPATEGEHTFLDFRTAVEEHFTRIRQVNDYARALGYSPRTLTRATKAATGTSAKEYIDNRVTLEARRLLVHGQDPVARIGTTLGFDDASNFVKFFAHRTGITPTAFRNLYRHDETTRGETRSSVAVTDTKA